MPRRSAFNSAARPAAPPSTAPGSRRLRSIKAISRRRTFCSTKSFSNPPGSDQGKESFELIGPAGASTFFTYVITLEGDSGTGSPTGVADLVIDISSATFGSNGILFIKTNNTTTFPYPYTINAASGVLSTALLDVSGGVLENGSNTFAIIYSPTTPITLNTDYDANDDGTLELLPADAVIIDAIGGTDGGAGDVVYSASVGAAPTATLGYTRYLGNTTPKSAAAWFFGTLVVDTGNAALVNYLAVNTGGPTGTVSITPGGPNQGGTGGGDTTPPTVTASAFTFDSTAVLPAVTVTFSESVTASLTTADFTVTNIGNPATTADDVVVPAANLKVSYNTTTNVATLNYTVDGTTAVTFPNGNYTVKLTASGVTDAAGNALAGGDLTFNFFALSGDADRNRSVDSVDFAKLIANFGPGTGKTFTQGDFNFDGAISSVDFNLLVTNYGQTLPAVPAALPAATPFAAAGRVIDDLADLLG